MSMTFELVNGSGTLAINRKYHPSLTSWKPRNKTNPRYSKRGGTVTGDGQVDARTITLDFMSGFKTDIAFENWANDLIRRFRKEYEPHYLVEISGTRKRRTRVVLDDLPAQFSKGLEKRVLSSVIKIIMEDSVWEDFDATTDAWIGASNGDQRIINVDASINGTCDDIDPIITVTALDDLPEFKIINTSIGAGFQISHPGFTSGKTMVIDSTDKGTVKVDGILIPQAISEGGYFFLKPGDNIMEYQSVYGQASIQTDYRKVYGY